MCEHAKETKPNQGGFFKPVFELPWQKSVFRGGGVSVSKKGCVGIKKECPNIHS